jgi:hypothetical protein
MKKRLNFKATNIPDLLAQGKNYYSRNPDGVIKHILDEHDRWRERVKRLKSNSGYYPKIYSEIEDGAMHLSTLVRIFREGKWWVVHVVESASYPFNFEASIFLSRFCGSVHKVQHLYQLTHGMITTPSGEPLEQLDIIQIDETDRLIQEMKWEQGER